MRYLLSYLLTATVFFALDLLWLGWLGRGIYQRHLGELMAEQVNWYAAIGFYLIFIVGIYLFAILPAVDNGSLRHALIYGALFGFFTYATWDLTNLATMKGFPAGIVPIDMTWGTILTGTVATAGYFIHRWICSPDA